MGVASLTLEVWPYGGTEVPQSDNINCENKQQETKHSHTKKQQTKRCVYKKHVSK